MKRLNNRFGFGAVELVIATLAGAALLFGVVKTITHVQQVLLRSKRMQQMDSESRSAMDTITQFVQQGSAETVYRCSCENISVPYPSCPNPACTSLTQIPFTRLEFSTDANTHYAFFWNNRTVEMETTIGASVKNARTLATNVDSLLFFQTPLNPGVVDVSLHMGNYDDPNNPLTLLISKEIKMAP